VKSRATVTWTFAVLLVICLTGSGLEMNRVEKLRPTAPLEETLYISSPQALKRISLGYNGLLADIYWTRAVQYFGDKAWHRAKRFDLLRPLLEITTALDPHLVVAYEFGSTFLAQKPPMGAGKPDDAIEYVREGIENNPNEWRLYNDLAFIYYFEKKDYASAGRVMEEGSRLPGAHPFMKTVAATLVQRGGDLETARLLWTNLYQTTNDAGVRDNAEKHLRALEVDETVPKLEALVRFYQQRTGSLPGSLHELVRIGWLSRVPVDPIGNPYKLLPDGHIEVEDYIDLPFIVKGLPPGQQPSLFDYTPYKDKMKEK
jgi:tetratricopeptide (TPR) repeat protein